MRRIWKAFFSAAVCAAMATDATAQSNYLTVAPPQKLAVKRGTIAEARLGVTLSPGYHVNSDKPADPYLIPLRLRWEPGPLIPVETTFPKAESRAYPFSQKPVSVFTDRFEIATKFKAAEGAPPGPGFLTGKLRYQACTQDRCFPPRTVEIKLPFSIH